jgi:Protein of unknown function (DUF3006)
MTTETKRFAVDRRERRIVIVIDDDEVAYDVTASDLPPDCRKEGAVFDAPVGGDGVPRWGEAKRNRDEESRRIREASQRLERLRQRDPGGDVDL